MRARVLSLTTAALIAGCSRAGETATTGTPAPVPPSPPSAGQLERAPSIVLVSVDTLRREHLSCYGYFRATTPRLDAFARESLVFDQALATMASTLPSHLSMLTGLYPHQHGMSSNLRGAQVPYRSELGRLSVAAVLARCGYATAGFASAVPLARSTGIGTGFETYDAPAMDTHRSARETNRLALGWLEQHAQDERPLLLFVHYFEPHEPSDPPEPYASLFRSDERQLAWLRARPIDPAGLTQRFGHSQRVQQKFVAAARPGKEHGQGGVEITLEKVADLMNRYDGELRAVDDALGELFDKLRALSLWEHSIVVFTGDHGQSLGENLWFGHGSITNLNTFVPLIVHFPAGVIAPGRIDALVSLVDLMPTVLARFELPGSELLRAQFEGEDVLSGAFSRTHALVERTTDVLADGENGPQYALLSGPWKYVYRPQGTDELYDLAGAGEFVDVLSANSALGSELRDTAREILARRPALLEAEEKTAPRPDARLIEGLRDLGYVGDDEGDR